MYKEINTLSKIVQHQVAFLHDYFMSICGQSTVEGDGYLLQFRFLAAF
jgi:hypothetical protein